MNVAEMIVPDWYMIAKKRGDDKNTLMEQVREFCLEALTRKAEKTGAEIPEKVDDNLVSTTIEMYEYALKENNRNI